MTPNIEALLHGYVSGKFYEWPLLRGEVAALIKEREEWIQKFTDHTKAVAGFLGELYAIMVDPLTDGVLKVAQMMSELKIAALRDRESSLELEQLRAERRSGKWRVGGKVPLNVYEDDAPRFQCHTPEEAARIVALLNRAEQRIPPGMTAEKLDDIVLLLRHGCGHPAALDAAQFCEKWAAWLRKQAEPGTAKETPTESSSSPEAKAEEQPKQQEVK